MVAAKILIVHDEPDLEPLVLRRMRRDIRAGRYEFVFAHDGVEAVGILSLDKAIDVMLTDINMPRMDGLTLLSKVSEVSPDTLSIVVSVYGDMPNIRTAMNRGAFDFITKPIDFQDLRLTISRSLSHLEGWRDARMARERLVVLESDRELAWRIQQSILPTVFPESRDYQISARVKPVREVSGDFYDVVRLEDGKVGIAIGDVSGRGMPAALSMMTSRTMLKGAAISYENPGDVLGEVNSLMYGESDNETFVRIFYGIYDPFDGSLTYANGGHESPLRIHRDGVAERLPATGGLTLGIAPSESFRQNIAMLAPGDTVLCYTDGIMGASSTSGEIFGRAGLLGIFEGATPCGAEEAVGKVFASVEEFTRGAVQTDDITCLALRQK